LLVAVAIAITAAAAPCYKLGTAGLLFILLRRGGWRCRELWSLYAHIGRILNRIELLAVSVVGSILLTVFLVPSRARLPLSWQEVQDIAIDLGSLLADGFSAEGAQGMLRQDLQAERAECVKIVADDEGDSLFAVVGVGANFTG
jgi:hypothetical protein